MHPSEFPVYPELYYQSPLFGEGTGQELDRSNRPTLFRRYLPEGPRKAVSSDLTHDFHFVGGVAKRRRRCEEAGKSRERDGNRNNNDCQSRRSFVSTLSFFGLPSSPRILTPKPLV